MSAAQGKLDAAWKAAFPNALPVIGDLPSPWRAFEVAYNAGLAEGRRMGLQEAAEVADRVAFGYIDGPSPSKSIPVYAAVHAIRAVLEPDKEKQ